MMTQHKWMVLTQERGNGWTGGSGGPLWTSGCGRPWGSVLPALKDAGSLYLRTPASWVWGECRGDLCRPCCSHPGTLRPTHGCHRAPQGLSQPVLCQSSLLISGSQLILGFFQPGGGGTRPEVREWWGVRATRCPVHPVGANPWPHHMAVEEGWLQGFWRPQGWEWTLVHMTARGHRECSYSPSVWGDPGTSLPRVEADAELVLEHSSLQSCYPWVLSLGRQVSKCFQKTWHPKNCWKLTVSSQCHSRAKVHSMWITRFVFWVCNPFSLYVRSLCCYLFPSDCKTLLWKLKEKKEVIGNKLRY